jgi:hypothetical protein
MNFFLFALFLVCASTLMYEVVLTRLLSVVSWYYLAFVSISTAMFGMTAGALSVQLRPDLFRNGMIRRRLAQCAMATAISMPVALLTMLAIPIDLSLSLTTVFSFVLFSAVIAVPFFLSGIVVCISLTRTPFPMGQVYFTDLAGAAFGCLASVLLLHMVDAPSAIFIISGVLFLGAAAYARYAEEARMARRSVQWAAILLVVGAVNSLTLYGIQPIWSKGSIDRRTDILAEIWNPISKIRAGQPRQRPPSMWGPSPRLPELTVDEIDVNIDNDASTAMTHFKGNLAALSYLRYDVTSLAAQLRTGGTAAVIGVGGGRDVLNCAVNGFRRIVGIEVNSAIVDLGSRRLDNFSGFSKIPGFELHNDEGRSYLTRSGERFDLIQASLVDTWAATSAGAMTLSENALYTVEGWKVFYEHLKPGGIITFSRWYSRVSGLETYRLLAVAKAMMFSEGVVQPEAQLALIQSGTIATLLASNQPFSPQDLQKIKAITNEMAFTPLIMPGEPNGIPEVQRVLAAKDLKELAALRTAGAFDYSPAYDSSPFFFNAVHLNNIPSLIRGGLRGSNIRAILFLSGFLIAAILLVVSTILLPAKLWKARTRGGPPAPAGGIVYFIAIGLGFMLVEMGMMQQLSIFLGHPIYSLVVVLAGLILSTGVGSLASDRWRATTSLGSRAPAIAAGLVVLLYAAVVLPVIHAFTAGLLWQRVLISLALVAPCGFVMGFCFPVGMRWMTALSQERNLPWMWALNGAAGALGSFVAIVVSMDTSIATCVLTGVACYISGGLAMPAKEPAMEDIKSVAAAPVQ